MHRPTFQGTPEGGALVEHVRGHEEGDAGEGDANQCTGDNVVRMVEVVTDPRQADPEGKGDHGELDEGSEDLDDPVEGPDAHVVHVGEVCKSGLEVYYEEGGTEEGKGGVSREERESSLVEHLHRGIPPVHLQAHADLLLLTLNELLVTPLVPAEARLIVVRLADCEEVRS